MRDESGGGEPQGLLHLGPPASWAALALLVATVSAGLGLTGLPSPLLFGSLIGGLAHALSVTPPPRFPPWTFTLGQGIIGVTVGSAVDWSALQGLGWDWPVIIAISAGTLLLSVAAGQVLRVHRRVDAVTASFASVAGGASGIVAMSRDLGADDRVVTVIQYLRVLVILLAMPAVVALVFDPSVTSSATGRPGAGPIGTAIVFTVLALAVGLVLGRLMRLPSPAILGCLVATVLLALLPPFDDAGVPTWIMSTGLVLIGVQVGLRFTAASVRAIGRMLPTAVLVIVLIIAGCAGLGVILAQATGVSQLDAYLATTPGGLYAVLAISSSTDGNVTFVTAVQLLRPLVVLLLAPLLAHFLHRRKQDEHPGGRDT